MSILRRDKLGLSLFCCIFRNHSSCEKCIFVFGSLSFVSFSHFPLRNTSKKVHSFVCHFAVNFTTEEKTRIADVIEMPEEQELVKVCFVNCSGMNSISCVIVSLKWRNPHAKGSKISRRHGGRGGGGDFCLSYFVIYNAPQGRNALQRGVVQNKKKKNKNKYKQYGKHR